MLIYLFTGNILSVSVEVWTFRQGCCVFTFYLPEVVLPSSQKVHVVIIIWDGDKLARLWRFPTLSDCWNKIILLYSSLQLTTWSSQRMFIWKHQRYYCAWVSRGDFGQNWSRSYYCQYQLVKCWHHLAFPSLVEEYSANSSKSLRNFPESWI